MDSALMSSPLPFLHLVERLKNTPRAGWVKRGIKEAESVSDHMYRMAIICILLPKESGLDLNKCVRMALVHDIVEAIIGDITPSDGVSKADKYKRESLAVEYLSCMLKASNAIAADEIKSLFEEYEERKTQEARFVGQIDAFECLVQAEEYEERVHEDHRLHEFLNLERRVTLPPLTNWTKLLAQERDAMSLKISMDTIIIFVIGGPGVGKGTQCTRFVTNLNLKHISVGDLLREEAKRSGSVYADFINRSIRESVVIPAQLTCDPIKVKMNAATDKGIRGFLVDGFPRSLDQALRFEEKIHEQNFTLFFDCPEDVMVQRLMQRATTSRRIDDNAESIAKRVRTFREVNKAVEEHLQQKGPFKTIQCTGSPEEVYAVVKPEVEAILKDAQRLRGS